MWVVCCLQIIFKKITKPTHSKDESDILKLLERHGFIMSYLSLLFIVMIFFWKCMIFFFFFFFFFGCSWGMWKFLSQESNPHRSTNLSRCSDNTGSVTCWATRELQKYMISIKKNHVPKDLKLGNKILICFKNL